MTCVLALMENVLTISNFFMTILISQEHKSRGRAILFSTLIPSLIHENWQISWDISDTQIVGNELEPLVATLLYFTIELCVFTPQIFNIILIYSFLSCFPNLALIPSSMHIFPWKKILPNHFSKSIISHVTALT